MATEDELQRSPAARRLAETALLWVLYEIRDVDLPMIVLGGLVPQVLTEATEGRPDLVPQHLGTTDVDVLIALHVVSDVDLAPLEAALERLGFAPDPKIAGWRWIGTVHGARIKFEFLSDLEDQPSNVVVLLPGCRRLTAANLRGTGYVAEDYREKELSGELASGERVTVLAKLAGLEGYLMSKAHAARDRGEPKDYYDFVYVLLFNRLGGPVEAAEALLNGGFSDRLRRKGSMWRELAARFRGPDDVGPRSYAEQALQADPAADPIEMRQDAIGAVQEFMDRLMG